MNKLARVSIIIPTYNHGHLIRRCIRSVVAQTFEDWEAIVVNNFSEDNTVSIVNDFKDSRIRVINFRNDGVIAASRNQGIRLAKGEYIAFLDSDDWWYPKKLECAVKYLGDWDLVHHDLDIYTKKGRKLFRKKKGKQFHSPVFFNLLSDGYGIFNSSTVVKKALINQVGGLCEARDLVSAEDRDLWLRISRVSEKFRYVPQTLGAYWIGKGNISKSDVNRILTKTNAIRDRYWHMLTETQRKKCEMNSSYGLGRAMQKMGKREEALRLYRLSLKSGSYSYEVKLKALLFMMMIMVSKRDHQSGIAK